MDEAPLVKAPSPRCDIQAYNIYTYMYIRRPLESTAQ